MTVNMTADEVWVMASTGIDTSWTMTAAILVMLMQAGFSMLEAGAVRAKNTQGILTKNLLDACIGAICWWCVGYGFAFGEDKGNKFIGGSLFGTKDSTFALSEDGDFHYLYWFFQWAFSATAATIVSGAVAERIQLLGYAIFMVVMTSFVYPVVVHWTWGGGWLYQGRYTDFAGSGIVHMCGGVAALVGAIVLGPRTGRFDKDQAHKFAPHSVPLVVLGTFILWFGWYGFNAGSTVSLTGEKNENANTAALVAVTTTLSAASGGLVVFLLKVVTTKKHDVCALSNGILAGLVSITAACDGVHGWSAIVIGVIGGFIYSAASALLKRMEIDDPLDAFAVHGSCGMWGVIAVAFFNTSDGIFYGGEDSGTLLGWQLCGVVSIAAWTGALSAFTFLVLKKAGLLRVSEEEERLGSDEHAPSKSYSFVMTTPKAAQQGSVAPAAATN